MFIPNFLKLHEGLTNVFTYKNIYPQTEKKIVVAAANAGIWDRYASAFKTCKTCNIECHSLEKNQYIHQ